MVRPQPALSAQLRIVFRHKWGACIQVLELYHVKTENRSQVDRCEPYIFHQHCTLITPPIAMSQRRNQSPGIHLEQRLRFLIWIDLDILIWDAFQLQCDPYPLHEWTAIDFAVSRRFAIRQLVRQLDPPEATTK